VISDTKLHHVSFRDCKLDDANFRFASGSTSCSTAARSSKPTSPKRSFTSSALTGCDLRRAVFEKASLAGTRLSGSTLDGLRGAGSLRGVVVGTDQVLPLALGVFGDLGIVISDGDEPA